MKFVFAAIFCLSTPALAEDPCLTLQTPPATQIGSTENSEKAPTQDLTAQLSLTVQERLSILCGLRQALQVQYTPAFVKKARLGIDVDEHLRKCAENEREEPNGNRLHFIERTQVCIAGLRDSHFEVGRVVEVPDVSTLLKAQLVGETVYITSVEMPLVNLIKTKDSSFDSNQMLKIGNKILAVDGVDILKAIEQLEPAVSSSTDLARKVIATTNLFRRDFRYPKRKWLDVTIQNDEGYVEKIRLPWYASGTSAMPEALQALADANIQFLGPTGRIYDPEKGTWSSYTYPDVKAFSLRNPLVLSTLYLKQQSDVHSAPTILATSEVLYDRDNIFCYLKISSFFENQVMTSDRQTYDFLSVVRSFLRNCEIKKLPLLLDLRFNPGGRLDLVEKVMSTLTPTESAYRSFFTATNTTKANIPVLLSQVSDPLRTGMSDIEELMSSIRRGEPLSRPMFNLSEIRADRQIGGYNQQIVALISPLCASGCDLLATFIKLNRRGILMGQPTNGTGVGGNTTYLNSSPVTTRFRDHLNLFDIKVPNVLFGTIPPDVDLSQLTWMDSIRYSQENQPVEPDIPYQMTLKDITDNGTDLLEKAMEIIRLKIAPVAR